MPINVCQKDQIIFCGSGTAVVELVVLMIAVVELVVLMIAVVELMVLMIAVVELVALMIAVVAVVIVAIIIIIINIPFILGQLEVLELLFAIRLAITVLIFLE